MDSAMIGKIEKAMRYANEPERIVFTQLVVTFKGDHDIPKHDVPIRTGHYLIERFILGEAEHIGGSVQTPMLVVQSSHLAVIHQVQADLI